MDRNEIKRKIAHNIKQFREERGLSQEELGKLVGKASTTVSTWERGTSMPNAAIMYELAKIFKKDIKEMYKDEHK